MDRNNDSRITISASEIACGEREIDVDFDAREAPEGIEQKLDDVVRADEYVETPNYDTATTELYDILQSNFGGESGSFKYDESCYNVSLERVYDD